MSPSTVSSAKDTDHALAMDATMTTRISNFQGTRFCTWKFKMQMLLKGCDLWEVTNKKIKLDHCSTALGQATFKVKSCKTLAIICLAMEDSQLPLVCSVKSTYDAWSRQEGHYKKTSLANKLVLRRRLFSTMIKEDDGVLAHTKKLKTLSELLEAVGALVSENDLLITLLGSLSESYQFLITALASRLDKLTWELVTARLLHEAQGAR